MGFKIVFTKPAMADLVGLVSFLGRVVPEFKIENIREFIHRPYRIVYRVRKDQKLIEILRVWHAARGIPRIHE